MADHDAQRVIAISLGKIANFNTQRRGCSLHKNLLVSTVIQRARTTLISVEHSTVSDPQDGVQDDNNPDWTIHRAPNYYNCNQPDNDVIANFNKLYVSEAVRWEDTAVVPCSLDQGVIGSRHLQAQCHDDNESDSEDLTSTSQTHTILTNMDNGITEVVRTYQPDDGHLHNHNLESSAPCQSSLLMSVDEEPSYGSMVVTRDEMTRKRRYFNADEDHEHLFRGNGADYSHKRQRRGDNPFWLKQAVSRPTNDDDDSNGTNSDPDEELSDGEAVRGSVGMFSYLTLTSDFSEATHKGWMLDHHQLLHYASASPDSPYTSTEFLVSNPSTYCVKRPSDLFGSLPIDVAGQTLALTV